jgi:hypothetical protein
MVKVLKLSSRRSLQARCVSLKARSTDPAHPSIQDYLKWKSSLFFRFLTSIVDASPTVIQQTSLTILMQKTLLILTLLIILILPFPLSLLTLLALPILTGA